MNRRGGGGEGQERKEAACFTAVKINSWRRCLRARHACAVTNDLPRMCSTAPAAGFCLMIATNANIQQANYLRTIFGRFLFVICDYTHKFTACRLHWIVATCDGERHINWSWLHSMIAVLIKAIYIYEDKHSTDLFSVLVVLLFSVSFSLACFIYTMPILLWILDLGRFLFISFYWLLTERINKFYSLDSTVLITFWN